MTKTGNYRVNGNHAIVAFDKENGGKYNNHKRAG